MSRTHFRSLHSYLNRTEEVYPRIDGTSFEDEVRLGRSDLLECQAITIHSNNPSHTVSPSCVASVALPTVALPIIL